MAESPKKSRVFPMGPMGPLLLASMLVAVPAGAAEQPFKPSEAKTTKPDLLGRTRTELRDANGRKVGDAVTTKPSLIGDTRTTVRDASGKPLGEAVTTKPGLLGETRTTIRGGTPWNPGITSSGKPNTHSLPTTQGPPSTRKQ